jgi:hypothetical protein
LKLKYDEVLSNFAFKCSLRRYNEDQRFHFLKKHALRLDADRTRWGTNTQ